MWGQSNLARLVGVAQPIIQAPMASATTPALVAAVAEAGGLGSLGCAMLTPAAVAERVAETRRLTDAPINLNFFANAPAERDPVRDEAARRLVEPYYRELGLELPAEPADIRVHFDPAMLETVLQLRPEVTSFHFGLPAPEMVTELKAIDSVILSTATTVHEARVLEGLGVDAIIAQGWEAGGHRGTFASPFEHAQVGTFALVPQVVDAVSLPVIAAGGIADGRGIAAALMLGATAVQLGTAFLRCPESAVPEAYRQALSRAGEDSTQVTRAFTGRPARSLRNRYVEEMADHADSLPEFPLMMGFHGPLRGASTERGLADFMPLWSGQAAALGDAIPATELVSRLVTETAEIVERGAAGS